MIAGSVKYHWNTVLGTTYIPETTWELSDFSFNVQTNLSQTRITGTLDMEGTVRIFLNLDFGKFNNVLLGWPNLTEEDLEYKSEKELEEQMTVVKGCKDRPSEEVAEVWYLVGARFPEQPPAEFGYPAFIGGRPPSIVCLCLSPVKEGSVSPLDGSDPSPRVQEGSRPIFRRVGVCEFWDNDGFWSEAMPSYKLSVV